MNLTTKQEIFVQRLIEVGNQSEAYRFAYNCDNMKDKTIVEKASKLMAQSNVRARYNELIEEHKKKALWTREKAEEKLLWLLDKSIEDIEYKGIKQANATSTLNTIKELNTLTDLYPKDKADNKEDKLDKYLESLEGAINELK